MADSESPLHASFDVSQLSVYRQPQQPQQAAEGGTACTKAAATFTRNYLDLVSAASSSSSASSTAKTPLRIRFPRSSSSTKSSTSHSSNHHQKASGKQTPASARRKRLFARRLSPAAVHRPMVQPVHASQSIFSWQHDAMDASPVVVVDASAATPAPKKAAPKRSLGTVTTVANSTILETTTETDDSAETQHPHNTTNNNNHTNNHNNHHPPSSNSFRFASFPASLPRIPTHYAPQKRGLVLERDNTAQATTAALPDAVDDWNNTSNHSLSLDAAAGAASEPFPPPQATAPFYSSLEDLEDSMSTSPMGTPVGRRRLNFNSVLSPGTPNDVKMHFQQSGQCSPIRGIPEEDGDLTSTTIRSSTEKQPAQSQHQQPAQLMNQSLGSSSTTTSTSSKAGSRPMPDMNAFEGDVSQDHSGDHKGSSSTTRSQPPSPKLLCPPTPVRTPAWVHAPNDTTSNHHHPAASNTSASSSSQKKLLHQKFGRQNSLIATKVLATCSQRDLDGRSSLESSLLLEEDSKQHHSLQNDSRTATSSNNNNNSSSILTFAESAAAATEPETDLASSDRDQSSQHHSVHHLDDDDDDEEDWLHEQKGKCRLFDDEEEEKDEPFIQEVVSMSANFDILGMLGRGTFADVYKVRSRKDGKLYAVKKHRRQFRGRRDRELTLAEVRHMQRLQRSSNNKNLASAAKSSYSLYLLFFYQAWQEDGYFFMQTELCCRDTCREFMDALRANWVTSRTRYPCLKRLPAPLGIAAGSDQDIIGRLVPEPTIWKICHDICAGLSHIHSHGLVHHDIKPSNIFLVSHPHFGAMCKIGDFGLTGDVGTLDDGQEGDQKYMAPELLSSDVKHPSFDIFSLGLTLYELASCLSFEVPSEGQLWHDLRRARRTASEIPSSRDPDLVQLICQLMGPDQNSRLLADSVLHNAKVQRAGTVKDEFLMAYISDVEEYEQRLNDMEIKTDDQTPRVLGRPRVCVSPSLSIPNAPLLFSSPKHAPPYA